MNHADVRERLELAAAEPGGLDRLAAGDTPESALVASHLAGCPSCLDELGRLRRTTGIIREVVIDDGENREDPVLPAYLRERTLAYVRELGVPRPLAPAVAASAGGAASASAGVVPSFVAAPAAAAGSVFDAPTALAPNVLAPNVLAPAASAPAAVRRGTAFSTLGRSGAFPRRAAWIASIAAAVVVSVVATSVLIGGLGVDHSGLAEVAGWTADVAAAPDAREVSLRAVDTGVAKGGITLARSSGALVVVVRALAAAPSGREYRCWLETATGRTWVGKMVFDDGLAYWVGTVPSLRTVPAGTVFGISIEDVAGTSIGGPPVLHGSL
jgi:hypothetical protein